MNLFDARIGHGFDAHQLAAGTGVTLGGVQIACDYRLVAHSDGDVLIHALCDALLGALGRGDIGQWFPDTDARFAGADSRILLRTVVDALHAAGYALVNADLTLIAEAPRVAAHTGTMRERLATDLQVTPDRVGVKATTNEGMGHIGRKAGVAAHAVVLIAPREGV